MEAEILRKVKENYGRWQDMKDSHSKGHWQETRGENCIVLFACINLLFSSIPFNFTHIFSSFQEKTDT